MLQGRLDIKYSLRVAFEETNYEPFYYKKTFNPFEYGDLSSCGLFAADINVYKHIKSWMGNLKITVSEKIILNLSFIIQSPSSPTCNNDIYTFHWSDD